MKEKAEQNDAFLAYCEAEKAQGKTRQEFAEAAITKFSLKNMHTFRAWLARLADPNKYNGKYSARAKALQNSAKVKNETTENAAVAG
jgi:hypothetical protein